MFVFVQRVCVRCVCVGLCRYVNECVYKYLSGFMPIQGSRNNMRRSPFPTSFAKTPLSNVSLSLSHSLSLPLSLSHTLIQSLSLSLSFSLSHTLLLNFSLSLSLFRSLPVASGGGSPPVSQPSKRHHLSRRRLLPQVSMRGSVCVLVYVVLVRTKGV